MTCVRIEKISESYCKILSSFDMEQEIKDHFTFYSPGYQFSPKFKARIWDGKISLFSLQTKKLPTGLLPRLLDFLNKSKYEYELVSNERYDSPIDIEEITFEEIKKFVDELNISLNGEIREYQYDAIYQAIRNKKITLKSPTSSGKSMMIYSICRYMFETERRVLMIVPTVMLVNQMKSDFIDYSKKNGFDVESNFHLLFSGQEKSTKKNCIISTWQSLDALKKSENSKFINLINSFDAIIFDEAHGCKSASMNDIMQNAFTVPYRIGTTGTIDNNKISQLTIEGNLGPVYVVTTTRELIEAKQVVPIDVVPLILNYSAEDCFNCKKMDYIEEVDYLMVSEKRNQFISNLSCSTTGTTLILVSRREKHALVLYNKIKEVSKRNVYYVSGTVDVEERERIRIKANDENCIIVATYKTMSTGVNLPGIEFIIFGSSSKAMIQILQSIGRGLRLKAGKTKMVLFDIVDNLKYKSRKNYCIKHFEERIKIYRSEKHPIKIKEVNIK